ncbi:RWP-RK domain-containing transcription factor isoform A [Chlorella sorokiniana]|uniref:RWP-RK domain-containing transcription factor isoform A n=1 Tax=Chlorella sorokiniana TaxID=3076 RepID=A0A2P6TD50_CHLSO|nr:RWP-RK domain-containing transcription factor isoform A [Chlorella sorokiniana]|eukprot:PRW20564.1 RWP-RK domain-containing transcription factor isoform A [Chlorella sorokiniana]
MDAAPGAKQAAGGASKLKAEGGGPASPAAVASPAAPAASPLAAATPPSAAPPLAAPSVTPGGGEGGAHLAAIECLLTASPDLALALMLAGGSEAGHSGEGAAAAVAGEGAPEAAAGVGAAAPAPAAKAPPRTKAALRAAAQQRAEKRGEKRQRLSNVTLSETDTGGEEEAPAAPAGAGAAAAAAAAGVAAAAVAAEGAAAAAAEKKPRAKKAKKALAPLGPRRYVCSDITMEILEREGCFDMTEWDATRHLGFGSATVLKKLVLPRLGMKVWPYRKRATMKGIREGLEVYLETHGHHADQEKVAELLVQVRAAEQHVRDNPKVCTDLSKEMTALRQRLYKLKNEEKNGQLAGDKWKHQINMLVNNTLRDFANAAAAGAEEGEGEGAGEGEEEQ